MFLHTPYSRGSRSLLPVNGFASKMHLQPLHAKQRASLQTCQRSTPTINNARRRAKARSASVRSGRGQTLDAAPKLFRDELARRSAQLAQHHARASEESRLLSPARDVPRAELRGAQGVDRHLGDRAQALMVRRPLMTDAAVAAAAAD